MELSDRLGSAASATGVRMTEQNKETTWGEVETQFHDAIDAVVDADRWVKRVQHDVTATLAKERTLVAESGHNIPMGISQWRDHGMKYGHWEHFSEGIREFARAQERQRILKLMSDRVYRDISADEDVNHYQLKRSGWNAFAQELRALLSCDHQATHAKVEAAPVSQQYVDGYNSALDDVVRLLEEERS